MAARGTRERRPAVWPWLVMPLIVLLVFYALLRVHKQPGVLAVKQPAAAQGATASQP
ncbi:MAG TPA: hypothetical protein VIH60_06350 [Steroidobacteraceae bacterium]|jgi:hypothetical protein